MIRSVAKGMAFGLAATIGGMLAMMYIDRQPPVEVLDVSPVSTTVEAGGTLVINFVIDRQRECQSTAERTLFDSQGNMIRFPITSSISFSGLGIQAYQRALTIPDSMPPGPSRYRTVVAFRCNPLHLLWPIVMVVADFEFTVIPGKTG